MKGGNPKDIIQHELTHFFRHVKSDNLVALFGIFALCVFLSSLVCLKLIGDSEKSEAKKKAKGE